MPNKPTTLREDIKSRVKNWAEDPEFWSKDIQDVIDSHSTELLRKIEGMKCNKVKKELFRYEIGYNQALDDLLASLEDNKK